MEHLKAFIPSLTEQSTTFKAKLNQLGLMRHHVTIFPFNLVYSAVKQII